MTEPEPGDAGTHRVAVSEWFHRAAGGSGETLLHAFDEAFAALWKRSCVTLGEVTLTAIVERVLHTAMEQFPVLGSLKVEASGLNCQALWAHPELRVEQISEGSQFVLEEFLTVLGRLTGEILTPPLHAELSKLPRPSARYARDSEEEAP